MNDRHKTKQQLIEELAEVRQRVAALEASKAGGPAEPAEPGRGAMALPVSQAVLEATTDIIFIANRAGEVLYANRIAAAAVGCDPNNILGKRQEDLFPPAMARRHTVNIAKVFQTGNVLEADGMYRFGSAVVWLNTRLVPLRDQDGRVTSVIGVARDITQRKQAEEALRQARDELERRVAQRTADLRKANEELVMFRRFVEASTQGFGMATLDGEIRYVNPTVSRVFAEGRSEAMIGQPISKYYPADYLAKRENEILPQILRKGHWEGEVSVSRGNRRYTFVQSSFLVRDEQGEPACVAVVMTDIAARKRAEEALRESRDELQMIYDVMLEGCLITELASKRLVRANAPMCRMLGYSEEELLSRSVTDIHPVAEAAATLERIQARAEGSVQEFRNIPVLRKDGTVFYADVLGNVFTYRGRGCVLALFRDATERRRAEQALAESEAKYKTLVEASPEAVVMTDLTGKITFFTSQPLADLYGFESVHELLGKNASDYIAPEDYPKYQIHLQRALEEGIARDVELDLLKKDGTRFPAEATAATVKDAAGRPTALIVVLRDITDRKQAEEALRQSYEELRRIYDSVVDGIMVADAATAHPIRANAAYCRWLGYSEEETLGISPERVHSPDVLPRVWEHLETVKQGKVARISDLPFLRKDGGTVYADVDSAPIRYNQRPAWISFFHDVSERKRAQDALEREHRTLRHLLQSSDHERQLIAYEIHDGLAQYLTGALMQFDAYRHLQSTTPKEAAKAFEAGTTMLRQGHFEARRLISGVRPPILDESGILAAIAHLVAEQRRQPGPKIEFHSEVSFERLLPTLENAIYRIVQEGLTNAYKHSKSDRVRVELVEHDDHLCIRIQDWGIGFDPAAVEDKGYGLEGIRERARLLGGSTVVESAPQHGACITVDLPLMAPG